MKRPLIAALVFVAIAAIACATFAAGTVTATPGDYVLRNADNTPIAGLVVSRFPTEDACKAAAAVLVSGRYKCDHSIALAVVATCDGEPAPRIYLPLVDLPNSGGAKGYELPEMEPPALKPGSDTDWMPERDWLYVHNSKWPDGYPNCWVRGFEDPSKWRQNAAKDPGKVFMELITPQNAAEVTELPNSNEPVCPQSNTDPRCPPWVPAS